VDLLDEEAEGEPALHAGSALTAAPIARVLRASRRSIEIF
jgi:hypothetical protein